MSQITAPVMEIDVRMRLVLAHLQRSFAPREAAQAMVASILSTLLLRTEKEASPTAKSTSVCRRTAMELRWTMGKCSIPLCAHLDPASRAGHNSVGALGAIQKSAGETVSKVSKPVLKD